MKRFTKLAIVVGLVVLAAAPSSAGTQFHIKAPFDGAVDNPCNGQPVIFSGDIHFLVGLTEDRRGGVHQHVHANFQGVNGIDSTGRQYSLPSADSEKTYTRNVLPRTQTSRVNQLVISRDKTDNFYVQLTVHMTFNANGEPTATVANGPEKSCRG